MSKKILAISNHGDMIGGGEHSFLDLISNLPNKFQSRVVLPKKGELSSRLASRKIETRIISLPPIRPWSIFRLSHCIFSIVQTCRNHCSSVIYANGSRAAFYGGIVGKITGTPMIWHCRIVEPDPYLDPTLKLLSQYIVVNSYATQGRFDFNARRKVWVVYNGIDLTWIRHSDLNPMGKVLNRGRVILMVARFSISKGHDIALLAFDRIAKKHSDIQLVFIGTHDKRAVNWWNFLQSQSAKSRFSDRIHWVGPIKDVRPWYNLASVLILPSSNESFGRVLVEAMACGVPVIGAKSGGIPEILRYGQDGLLIPIRDASRLAEAIDVILTNHNLRERLSIAAVQRSNFFSLQKHVEQMVEIFEKAIEGSKTNLKKQSNNNTGRLK